MGFEMPADLPVDPDYYEDYCGWCEGDFEFEEESSRLDYEYELDMAIESANDELAQSAWEEYLGLYGA